MNGLVDNLRTAGLCAERDPDDALQQTIRVKDATDFSEDFDVLLASGHMRRGERGYRRRCTPPSFPVDRAADAPADRQRLRPAVSAARHPVQLQDPHLQEHEYYTLDSTPLVGPDPAYCAAIGYTDRAHRARCARRAPRPRRPARTGASATPRTPASAGPTWTQGGRAATARARPAAASNHPDNQYAAPDLQRPGLHGRAAQTGRELSPSATEAVRAAAP